MAAHEATSDPLTSPSLAALADADRHLARARFQLLRPHLEDHMPLTQLAVVHGRPLRTLQRWTAAYRRAGLAGLARAPRRDHGTRRLPAPLVALVEGLALRSPRPTAATVYRQVGAVAQDQHWPIPSYSIVYAIIAQLDPALTTLAHDGGKAYAEAFDLIHRREASGPNAIWQADHTPLDL